MQAATHIRTSQLEDLEPCVCQASKAGTRRGWRACLRVNGETVWASDVSFRNRDATTWKSPGARDVAQLIWHLVRDDSAPAYLATRLQQFKVRSADNRDEWTGLLDWASDVAVSLTID